jgi:hypothetical protein
VGQTRLVQIACTVFGISADSLPRSMVAECEGVLKAALAPPCLALTTRLQQTLKLVVRAAALRQVRVLCVSVRLVREIVPRRFSLHWMLLERGLCPRALEPAC